MQTHNTSLHTLKAKNGVEKYLNNSIKKIIIGVVSKCTDRREANEN